MADEQYGAGYCVPVIARGIGSNWLTALRGTNSDWWHHWILQCIGWVVSNDGVAF